MVPRRDPRYGGMTLIDARGLLCPLPVLRLQKTLRSLPEGAEVTLLATDPAAVIDVPHFCNQGGHHLIDATPAKDGGTQYRIRRGPDRPEVPSEWVDA